MVVASLAKNDEQWSLWTTIAFMTSVQCCQGCLPICGGWKPAFHLGIVGQRVYLPSPAALPSSDMVLIGTPTHLPGSYTTDTTDASLLWFSRQPNPQSRDYTPVSSPPPHLWRYPKAWSIAPPQPAVYPPISPSGQILPIAWDAPPLTGTKGTPEAA